MVDAERVREPTTFADWHAINTLLMTYAEHVDAGRFGDVAAMFEHSTYRIEHGDGTHVSSYEGSAPVQAFCEQTRLYPDGTPRTRHVITNVVIDVDGDRGNAWGQDRAHMDAVQFNGIGRSLLQEEDVIQTSMGPILDRTKENLSGSDVAVAHLRRMLLDAVAAYDAGTLPPGSALAPDGVRFPNASEMLVDAGRRWEDAALDHLTT